MTVFKPDGNVISYVTQKWTTVGTFADEFHTWYAKPNRIRYTKYVIQETLDYFKRK